MGNRVVVAGEARALIADVLAILGRVAIPAVSSSFSEAGRCGESGCLLVLEYSSLTSCKLESVIQRWREGGQSAPVILIAPQSTEEGAIQAIRLGVSGYLRYPLKPEDLCRSVRPFLGGIGQAVVSRLGGRSGAICSVRDQIANVALSTSNVLITGETGTGKEVVAQLIHEQSSRGKKPFVCVNCAAIPDSLLESELFGHERGAFTGAQTNREGKIKLAHGGTLFLDEIGEMSLYAQAKILRAIETHEIWALGSSRSQHVDVRVIAATNRNLDPAVRWDQFRPDLFFRLNVARIRLPPLRERLIDVPVLTDQFIAEFNQRFSAKVERFSDEAMAALLQHDWPGNIRELRNLVESVFVNRPQQQIEVADLIPVFSAFASKAPPGERERLIEALHSTNWNVSSTALKLNWSRMTIYRKMAKYHVAKAPKAASAKAGGRK